MEELGVVPNDSARSTGRRQAGMEAGWACAQEHTMARPLLLATGVLHLGGRVIWGQGRMAAYV